MGDDPYTSGQLTRSPYARKSTVIGRICAVLDLRLENRGLELISQPSRAVSAGQVHELLLTDESGLSPGSRVGRVGGIGFLIVDEPGVLLRHDRVLVAGELLGTVGGFDETHAPNHYNIVVCAERMTTGTELGLALGDQVEFVFPNRKID